MRDFTLAQDTIRARGREDCSPLLQFLAISRAFFSQDLQWLFLLINIIKLHRVQTGVQTRCEEQVDA